MPDNRVALAHIPAHISLNLFGAVGSLLDTCLHGAMLAPGNGREIAGTIELREDQTQQEAVRLLQAAQRRIVRKPPQPAPDTEPADPAMATLAQIQHTPDGQIEFGIGTSQELAWAMSDQLLSVYAPAFEETGAPNYLSWDLRDRDTGKTYSLIIVKPDGLTPHEARVAADKECDRLRALLAEHGIEDPHA